MNIDFTDLLKRLEPYQDRVFYFPLSKKEVAEIESLLDKKFPDYYVQYLLNFGLKQDFVFGLYSRGSDYKTRQDYLPTDLKSDFICIGDNGGEDFWLINAKDETDVQLYEWQHWADGALVTLGFGFSDLLENSLKELRDNYTALIYNVNKAWCVQFAIQTNEEERLLKTIDAQITTDWQQEETTSAGVTCYTAQISLNDTSVILHRQEFLGWEYPHYYFDLNEPVANYANSQIHSLDHVLKGSFKDYTLIDYGILRST